MNKENNDMATRMLERDEQLRAKFEERKAHMEANNERIKTPDGWKPPKRCDSVALTTDDGKRHTAFICDAKHQPNDWGTDYPSFTLTCRLVWGRCDAADFTLSIDTELLSPRTAKLCPWHISEISLPKWTVVFSDGSIIDMNYCRLTPITDMQTIRDSANVQRIIEAHFSGCGNMAVKTKKLTAEQERARKGNGLKRCAIPEEDHARIKRLWKEARDRNPKFSKQAVARAVKRDCLEKKITRKDRKPPTTRNILFICEKR